MARIWAKLITDEKIIKDCMINTEKYYTIENFTEYMQEICYILDIPNPIILNTHFSKFTEFNHIKFIKEDFVEEFPYDRLVLEKA